VPINDVHALLTSQIFSRQNAEKVDRVCYDASRLVYERQKQMKKTVLKTKEISAALLLAETLHASAFRFVAEGNVAYLPHCDEAKALDYYQQHVMGIVNDKYGRSIVIDEDGMNSLYKDPSSTAHVVASANYEEGRGKRLPWIRHTLENSDAVYVEDEPLGRAGIRRKYFYTAIVTTRLQRQPDQTSYYVVLVREGKNQILRMVTAFSMFERDGYLHTIAMSSRYVLRNRRVGDKNLKVVDSI
jgi:hypothetical protein